jgi:adenosylcobinamide-GDP ribazoletransferase
MGNTGMGPVPRINHFKNGLRATAIAGLFLTRLPFRPSGEVKAGDLADVGWAYPIIGLLIGVISGGSLMLAAEFDLHPLACAFIGLSAAVLITGGLHEDGLADVADGFGGGHDRDSKLRIMRDSRIGAYGVLALIFSVGIRASILAGLPGPGLAAVALVGAAILSRSVLPVLMVFLNLARTDGLAATAGRARPEIMFLTLGVGLLLTWPFVELSVLIWGLLAALITSAIVGVIAHRQIGGYTGDVLGSNQQLAEISVLCIAGALAL